MKKLSCILLAVMLITAMFVSCKAEVIDDSNLVSVHFTTDDNAKGLNWSRPAFDSSKYYWYVVADKKDGGPKTGQGTLYVGSNLAPEEGIGPFSQGAWEFTLEGYSDPGKGTLVYKGTGKGTLTKDSNSVSVPVESQMQGNGSIHISKDIVLKDKGGVSYAPTNVVVMTSDQNTEVKNAVFDKTSGNTFDIEAGYYAVTIKMVATVNEKEITYSSNTIYVNVYAGQTTTIGGTLDESTTSTKFEAEDGTVSGNDEGKVEDDGSATISVSVAPSAGSTIVEFPAGSLEKGKTAILNVVAYPSSVSKSFSINPSNGAVVSGIDLSLTVDGANVDTFNGKEATVTTYVATGLVSGDEVVDGEAVANEGLRLVYNGSEADDMQPTIVSYDPKDGKLVFTTTHFSQYYVASTKIVAVNTTTNATYTSLQDAIDAASEGATVSLLKDVDLVETVDINKKITLDLQNHELSSAKFYALRVGKGGDAILYGDGTITSVGSSVLVYDDGRLVVDGCTIISSGNCGLCVGHLAPNSGEVTDSSSATAIIKNATITAQEAAIMVFDESSLTINDGVFTAKDNFVVGMNGRELRDNENKKGCSIEINGGVFNGNINTTGYIACGVYICNKGTVTLNGGTFNITDGIGVLVRSGKLIANSGVSFNIKKTGDKSCGGIGDASAMISLGSPIVIEDYNCITYPGGKPSCKNNSTYEGRYVSYEASIGDVYYESIHDAVAAATEGKTVKVLEDVDLEHTIVVNGKAVLDINGKTISNSVDLWDARPDDWSLISVRGTGKLTITGNGTLQAKENDCYAVDVQDGATLTIKDGKFVGNMHAVYVHTGTANIEGGTYSVQQKYPDASKADEFVLNCYDASRANGTAKIIVSGGTFVNFNPANCQAEGDGTNFVKDGCTVTSEGKGKDTLYTVTVVKQ